MGSPEVVEAQLFHDEVLQVEPEKRLRHSWRGGSDELAGTEGGGGFRNRPGGRDGGRGTVVTGAGRPDQAPLP